MKKPDPSLVVIVLCAVAVVALSVGLGYLIRDKAVLAADTYETVREAADTIGRNFYYIDDEKESRLVDNALRGMVAGLEDPYASYLTAEEYDEMLTEDKGEYTGLGISVAEPNDEGSVILSVYDNSPAQEAGLLAGDLIVTVNGTDAGGLSMDAYIALFSEDDAVPDVLVIHRGEEERIVTVLRRAIHVNRVFFEELDGGIGYIRLTEFNGTVASEFWAAATGFRDKGLDKLIIDLRNNPGGGLTEVLAVSDHLIPEGEVISTIRSKSGSEVVYRSEGKEQLTGMELVILVNGNSASASEFLTGAMQDHGLATVIGTQTYGKGIVQSYFRLQSNGGWIKMTTDAYFTPNGVCIQDTGITPDIVVELPEELQNTSLDLLSHDQDTQLQAAIRYLEKTRTGIQAEQEAA